MYLSLSDSREARCTSFQNSHVFVRGYKGWIIRINVDSEAINRLFALFFFRKSAKYSIPNDEDTRMVAVEVAGVGGVMYSVMRRCIKNKLNPRVGVFSYDFALVDIVVSPVFVIYVRNTRKNLKTWSIL